MLNYAIDWILGKALHEEDGVALAPGRRLADLDYADDIALLASNFGHLQSMVSLVNEVPKSISLSINARKTKDFFKLHPCPGKSTSRVGFFPAATHWATVTTGGLNQARVSSVVCASTPGMSDSRDSHFPPLKKSYGGGDSNSITETTLPPPPLVPIMATKTTCPTPAPSVATSDYLPPDTVTSTTTVPSTSDEESEITCTHCDRTFTSHIGLLSYLQIHRTETGELVPGAPTHSRDGHL
ncbi:unnamed protein product [Schistocephalus solidus]|uniref:C2H2-type domain-containing protein n=1 Tax=Schistocephalus solidus TaxID=70667 RepID=A0A183TAN1_SCHSO|nr:unnamed protein product [Schistocephalus solidus]